MNKNSEFSIQKNAGHDTSVQQNKAELKKLVSSATIDIVEHATKRAKEGGLKFPTARLNQYCSSVGPGYTVAIMGAPASGKTSFAQNIVFLNSVLDNKKTLYLYLEDMPERYQYNIFSRYSYHIGDKIESNALKRGISPSEHEAIQKLNEIQDRFREEQKGLIYYVGMSELSAEPMTFVRKLASLIRDFEIDIIITDYIQRVKSFKPQDWYSTMDYQNQIVSMLSSLALGQYGNPPCINIMLSQLNRDGQKKASRPDRNMSLFDCAEASSIERDSMLVLGVNSDQELRDRGEIRIQILKNRDNTADVTADFTCFDPAYCVVGDVLEQGDNISGEDVGAMWEKEYSGL